MKTISFVLLFTSALYCQSIIHVPQDYKSIQTAVDSSNAADTILVSQGIYKESLIISKPINIIGDSNSNVIIKPEVNYTIPIQIRSKNVLLCNIHLTKPSSNIGILLENADNCIIDNCVIDSNLSVVSFTKVDYYGIDVEYSRNILISNSIVKDNKGGTYFGFGGSAIGCDGIGLVIDSSSSIEVKNCLFENNKGGETNVLHAGKGIGIKLGNNTDSVYIRNSSIYKNYIGFLFSYNSNAVVGGSPQFTNNIYANSNYNIVSESIASINATYNNWGTDNVDSIAAKISGDVDFRDFVTNIDSSESQIPQSSVLLQNYPNPFNPSTHILYKLPSAGKVKMYIYDSIGRIILKLFDGYENFGSHELLFDGGNLSSGLYYYILEFKGQEFARKMLLLK